MTTQASWDPWRELLTVQKRMNKLFDSALGRSDFEALGGVDTWTPVCDVYRTPDSLVVCLELSGLSQERIELRMEGDDLIVSGEREMDKERRAEQFHRVERSYGKFSRRFHLPTAVDREAVSASYRDGVLSVVLPNRDRTAPRPIRVAIR